jgi:hypothetical protein
LEIEAMLSHLIHGLNGRAPEGKKAAKQACIHIAACLGEEEYDEMVKGIKELTEIQVT